MLQSWLWKSEGPVLSLLHPCVLTAPCLAENKLDFGGSVCSSPLGTEPNGHSHCFGRGGVGAAGPCVGTQPCPAGSTAVGWLQRGCTQLALLPDLPSSWCCGGAAQGSVGSTGLWLQLCPHPQQPCAAGLVLGLRGCRRSSVLCSLWCVPVPCGQAFTYLCWGAVVARLVSMLMALREVWWL